ncbi:DUF4334 domain-containing protein [Streptomyces sp. NPDC057743]|uniref:DUF4334 domain-containing protein n=1 Tax=Streptomyces sp. NPDC057743 TaxID=3346236 RepID=UPI0036C366D3
MDTSQPASHPPLEIVSIADTCSTALQNMPPLEIWLKEFGLPVSASLVPLMSLQTAFMTPWLPAESCSRISRLMLWLMAIDNVLDAPDDRRAADRAGSDPTDARVRAWHRVLAGHDSGAASPDPMARALADLVASLERDGRPELVAVWRESMHQTLDGMAHERRATRTAATGGQLPPLADYLTHGARTIGVEQQVTALWTLLDEPDLPHRLPVLLGALRQAAIAIRLLNDLRGHHRERDEGKVDALALGLTEQEAYARAQTAIDDCRRVLAPLTAAGYGSAVALERAALWHARMYHRFDPVRPDGPAPSPLPAGPTTTPTPATDTTPSPPSNNPGTTTDTRPTPRTPRSKEAPPMGIEQEVLSEQKALSEQEVLDAIASGGECDGKELAALFDRLEPVDTALLIGTWQGGGFERTSENARLLTQMRWYGKRFVDADHVEPLLCRDEQGAVFSFEEMGLATLHEVVFRGKPSTAMVYDQLPIIDHFRRLTDDVLLCVMDKKGAPADCFFHLTRVQAPTP